MLDLNKLREEFAHYLVTNAETRHSMDGALMHVCRLAYEAGLAENPKPQGAVSLAETLARGSC